MLVAVGAPAVAVRGAEEADRGRAHGGGEMEEGGVTRDEQVALAKQRGGGREVEIVDAEVGCLGGDVGHRLRDPLLVPGATEEDDARAVPRPERVGEVGPALAPPFGVDRVDPRHLAERRAGRERHQQPAVGDPRGVEPALGHAHRLRAGPEQRAVALDPQPQQLGEPQPGRSPVLAGGLADVVAEQEAGRASRRAETAREAREVGKEAVAGAGGAEEGGVVPAAAQAAPVVKPGAEPGTGLEGSEPDHLAGAVEPPCQRDGLGGAGERHMGLGKPLAQGAQQRGRLEHLDPAAGDHHDDVHAAKP